MEEKFRDRIKGEKYEVRIIERGLVDTVEGLIFASFLRLFPSLVKRGIHCQFRRKFGSTEVKSSDGIPYRQNSWVDLLAPIARVRIQSQQLSAQLGAGGGFLANSAHCDSLEIPQIVDQLRSDDNNKSLACHSIYVPLL
jgi:hypothetical protein